MTPFSDIWQQVEELLTNNISLIPVRDHEELVGDKIRAPKTPIGEWKIWQSQIISKEELFHKIEQSGHNAIAIVCGKVSGNLEVIDVDVKWKPGVDSRLFNDIKTLYPDLLAKLRIHKSPSGGCHILYRIDATTPPGNQKLAKRLSTDEELAKNPKEKTKCFLETRGEGGYVVAPPSMGYIVRVDNPIPVITWEERCSLIQLCKCYDELPAADLKPYKPSKRDDDYYEENPFEHFNNSPQGESVLSDNGWKYDSASGDYIHFTRPGKDSGISASWIKPRRLFRFFTSNSEFEESKCYYPATALSIILHGGDKKKTYQYLVSKGYGKIKPYFEKQLVSRKAVAKKPLPPNVSSDAKAAYDAAITDIAQRLPYGPFWKYDEDDDLYISREAFITIANQLGFFYYKQDVVRITGHIIERQEPRAFYDVMKKYVNEPEETEYEAICNCYELFVQKSGEFMISRLPLLDESRIMADGPAVAYKFYQNGWLTITAGATSFLPYENLPDGRLVWSDRVWGRDFNLSTDPATSLYLKFLAAATNSDETYLQKIIGYLAHEYKDETTGYIIVLTEECPDPRQGGGSGKNIFGSLLKHITTYTSAPGSQVSFDEKFMQSWNGERILAVSDVPKNFDFLFLKELSTGSGKIKKLWKNEEVIDCAHMPKFIIQTNYSYEVADGGMKRRIIPLEFTDFFTRSGGVDVYFKSYFPNDWSQDDWAGFDTYIAWCIQMWFRGGRKLSAAPLAEGGWHKQFEQTYGQVIAEFIDTHYEEWVKAIFITNEDFKRQLDSFYADNSITPNYRPSLQKINKGIEVYCEHKNLTFVKDMMKKDNGITYRGRQFLMRK